MTRQEFIELAIVNVTPEEYRHIESVYMFSDVDKYEFCAMWRKMNATRVAAARRHRADAEQRQQICDRLFEIAFMNHAFTHDDNRRLALNVFTLKEQSVIESAGIDWQSEPNEDGFRHFYRLDEMLEIIRKYIAA